MRKLTLRKETLAPLSDEELASLAGGASWVCLTNVCLTEPCITPPPYTGLKCYLTEGCA